MAEYKAKAVVEVKKGDRIYSFHCENNSPLGEIYDAMSEMRAAIVHSINESEKNDPPKKTEGEKECPS